MSRYYCFSSGVSVVARSVLILLVAPLLGRFSRWQLIIYCCFWNFASIFSYLVMYVWKLQIGWDSVMRMSVDLRDLFLYEAFLYYNPLLLVVSLSFFFFFSGQAVKFFSWLKILFLVTFYLTYFLLVLML